jgi:hypothetical protein
MRDFYRVVNYLENSAINIQPPTGSVPSEETG